VKHKTGRGFEFASLAGIPYANVAVTEVDVQPELKVAF
jgi:hypothetical protein